MNPIVNGPNYSTGIDGNPLYINVLFNGPNYGLSDPPLLSFIAGSLVIDTSAINIANTSTSFTLQVDISNIPNYDNIPIEIIVRDTNNIPCFDQHIGVANNLSKAIIIIDTSSGTAYAWKDLTSVGQNDALINLENETLRVLENLVEKFSANINAEVQDSHSEFVVHVKNAQRSARKK